MKYRIIPVTRFTENCIIVWSEKGKRAAIVDPGGESDRLIAEVTVLGVTVDKILLTHGHLDHIGAACTLAEHYDVSILGPQEADKFWFDNINGQSGQFGLPEINLFYPDYWLNDRDVVEIGDEFLDVVTAPGHTPGHIIYVNRADKFSLVGDVIFENSIGRTDFEGGSYSDLLHSIKHKVLTLGDDMAFIPGHGSMSTVGHERLHNPYIRNGSPRFRFKNK